MEEETAMSPHIEMLVRENSTLKTWVRGLLEECEGCTSQARAWAESLDAGYAALEIGHGLDEEIAVQNGATQ